MENMKETGIVKWFSSKKGYGFIQRQNGEDIFVHYSAIKGEGYRELFEGKMVEFTIVDSDRGLVAQEVRQL